MIAAPSRLRKHADYQRVYSASRKQFSRQMSYFFAPRAVPPENAQPENAQPENARPATGSDAAAPRVGLTVGKAMGKAVDRNRIKRRLREAVRRNLALLTAPVDVILHPRRSVLTLDFAELDREVAQVFRAVEKSAKAGMPAKSAHPKSPAKPALAPQAAP
jgi:ribonuclease P protein component